MDLLTDKPIRLRTQQKQESGTLTQSGLQELRLASARLVWSVHRYNAEGVSLGESSLVFILVLSLTLQGASWTV